MLHTVKPINQELVTISRLPSSPSPTPSGAPARPEAKGPQVLNARIRANEFRLIEDGGSRIVNRAEAEALAAQTGLDLVVVSLDSSPPVIKLVDFGKFKYEAEKRARDAKKKQHVTTVKEIKMTVRIDDNDYMVKVRRAQTFLAGGDKVKLTLRLKGREVQHAELAFALAKRFVVDLEPYGTVDGRVRQEGRAFVALVSPLAAPVKKEKSASPKKETPTHAKDENP
jgi:translation initiation factor IF-3